MKKRATLKSRLSGIAPDWVRRLRRKLSGLPDFLTAEPRPMIFLDKNIVVSWSAKSACTDLMLWYFAQDGLLDEAMALNHFPHVYRSDRYYGLPQYRARARALAACGGKGYTLVRVTRDPAKRLVSIFRHVLRPQFMDDFVAKKIGRDPSGGLSLQEFDRVLMGEDLGPEGRINMHCHAQEHPVWHMAFDRVITLNIDTDDMHEGLAQIEKALGLRHVPRSEIGPFLDKSAKRYAKDQAPSDLAGPLENHRFGRKPKALQVFPKTALQNHPMVARMAAQYYGADQAQVASGDTAGELFNS